MPRRAEPWGAVQWSAYLAAGLLLALPWLNPFSAGPTPAVAGLLFAWACAALALPIVAYAAGARLAPVVSGAWLAAALVSAALGVLQYFGAVAGWGAWVNSPALGEAYANLRQRNQFATLANMGLAALLWWVAACRPGPHPPRSPWRRYGALCAVLLAAVVLAVGNAASSSRTGLVQLGMLLAMAWMWRQPSSAGRRGWRVAAVAVLAYSVAMVALPLLAGLDLRSSGILARLQAGDALCASRLTLWSNVLHLIAQKPWFGWGWGELDYAHFITLYSGPRLCAILDNAHNLPLQLAVELGVPLAVVACALCGWMVWRAQPWRETCPTRQLAWSVLALIGLHSLLEYPLWYGPFQVAALLCVGLLWASPKRGRDRAQAAPEVPRAAMGAQAEGAAQMLNLQVPFNPLARALIGAAAIILIAWCAFVAWEYWRVSQIYLAPASRAEAYRENTLEKIQGSWLFQPQVQFAELTTTPLRADNAAHLLALAQTVLHFSPEPQVVHKLIDSAELLGRAEVAAFYRQRFTAAFGPQPPALAP